MRHFNSQCLHVPSSTEVLIAQNSTVILLNTTEYYMSGRQNCYEPNIVIKTEYLVNVSVVPCENLQYSDCIPISRTSLEYTNAKNPLPVVFDENHSPNYLVNGHINVTVNISTSKFNPLTPEYIYFCLYTDYDQFESVRSKSSKSYWKKYRGKQCSRQQLDSNGDATILKNTFKITRLEYVFIDFGSTVDPLDSFQFNVNGFGQMLLYPTRSSFIKESCDLSDGQDSCKLALNLAHNSEAMCIIGYRQRDRSGVPFGELTVTLSTKIDNKFRICIMIVCAVLTSIGILFLLALCVVQICNCRKVFKSDSVVSEGPSSVQASEGENPPS